MTLDQAKQMNTAHCSKHKRELEVIYYCPDCDDEESNQVQAGVSPIFTEEEHRILNLLLASKIAEIRVNINYNEPLDQRMGKVKLMNILNDIGEKVKIRC